MTKAKAADSTAMLTGHLAALEAELREAEGVVFMIEDGVALLDVEDPKSLPFIVAGLRAQLAVLTGHIEAGAKAAAAARPRLPHGEAMRRLVECLAEEAGFEVPKADLPALVRAYEAESEAAEPRTAAGVVFDRAMRRLSVEAVA